MQRPQERKSVGNSYVTLAYLVAFYSNITSCIDKKFDGLELLIAAQYKAQVFIFYLIIIANKYICTLLFIYYIFFLFFWMISLRDFFDFYFTLKSLYSYVSMCQFCIVSTNMTWMNFLYHVRNVIHVSVPIIITIFEFIYVLYKSWKNYV